MQRCPPHSATTATICPYHECNRFKQQVSTDPTTIACNTETRPDQTYRMPQLLFFSMIQRRSDVYRAKLKRSTAPHPQSLPHSQVFFRTLFSGVEFTKTRKVGNAHLESLRSNVAFRMLKVSDFETNKEQPESKVVPLLDALSECTEQPNDFKRPWDYLPRFRIMRFRIMRLRMPAGVSHEHSASFSCVGTTKPALQAFHSPNIPIFPPRPHSDGSDRSTL